jgi:hypothetical protein
MTYKVTWDTSDKERGSMCLDEVRELLEQEEDEDRDDDDTLADAWCRKYGVEDIDGSESFDAKPGNPLYADLALDTNGNFVKTVYEGEATIDALLEPATASAGENQ